MTVAYIGLGSNLGDKASYLEGALAWLAGTPGIQLVRVASLYQTAPWGKTDQDWFLNTVAEVATDLSPTELLQALLDIEKNLGRTRDVKWGPRTIDLDLLLYGKEQVDLPGLRVPHPRLAERAFVLVPLAELCPDMILPEGPVKELAERAATGQAIKKMEQIFLLQ
ncbi:2-amino-4-hydroxy-6-hydroxymethyldihydropteridine pyrophosphokinase [Desulforamulus profundi]|uniref:2-amino-4-hydroxy-6-hydroxymethyldihydropteridine diphosphokinase n=1 Tax=Desulforamulus profundi TaxID=1383067 RepID=A0A2C6MG84_9FIRM|nr:2-amino-4-hydroxy-6-hydroxymethyldihydropteridine diphosphokinase [Desulforamulus profundi]MCL4439621.1 2-amino-4-hydroxy-6-hydroxymethyldihydropteridine diphosphokinase [Bacillota bacterium]MCL5781603.1 2-amino-4-hydroxy-6-hydroxymethyldihydropteridine diphosphokinase [Bacillota bacterium]PHJ38406.1 2-amino-4-hydroxy-6-hydroxymethyldihydropteridine pyrophosphokinase [Desulforamulus profundi]